MRILACDAGSSSYKASLYQINTPVQLTPPVPLWSGEASWEDIPGRATILERRSARQLSPLSVDVENRKAAIHALFARSFGSGAGGSSLGAIDAAAHRVVHGGRLARHSVVVTDDVKSAIEEASPLAPEHNPMALAGIEVVEGSFGQKPQVAIFDSEFHATLPEEAYTYAVPLAWRDDGGMRRLGFHGISHRYVSERCAQLLGKDLAQLKIVSCHLGNGCSLAAIDAGRSIDTTMGWTPMEGLVMGERSGDIDPGLVLQLIESGKFTAAQLRRTLNEECGLKGISGTSGDMRDILAGREKSQPHAKLAFDVYVHRLRRAIGSMIASLDGLDALVFTGGIGENTPALREAACSQLACFGLNIDRNRNKTLAPDARISVEGEGVAIFVIKSEERWELVRECFQVLGRDAYT